MVERSLRASLYGGPRAARNSDQQSSRWFWIAVTCLLLQFALPPTVFNAMGFNFSAPGGNPLTKLHPATLVAIPAALIALFGSRRLSARIGAEAPGLVAFLLVIPLLGFYSIYFTGFSGSAVYIESYWSAGLLAVLLYAATDRQKRLLAYLLLTLCLLNVFISVWESIRQEVLFPLYLEGEEVRDIIEFGEFRSHAFYGHPLTGAMITSTAIFMLYVMRMRFWLAALIFGLFIIGMFAFGGRAALAVTLALSVVLAVTTVIRGLVTRQFERGVLPALLCGIILLPLLIAFVLTQTSLGDRVMNTLYFDSSAEARATQWEVFSYLPIRNFMFGSSLVEVGRLRDQIGLGGKGTDIENFWILMFLNLGVFGFIVFLIVFIGYLTFLARQTGSYLGWVIVISAIIIDSSSNSLGVKSSDLFILTGFMMASAGFRQERLAQASASHSQPEPVASPARPSSVSSAADRLAAGMARRQFGQAPPPVPNGD